MTTSPKDENFVSEVKSELAEIDQMPIDDHGAAFDLLHQKLSQALSTIDGI